MPPPIAAPAKALLPRNLEPKSPPRIVPRAAPPRVPPYLDAF
jgi:hypothetical protein